jgi:hypothetical protein
MKCLILPHHVCQGFVVNYDIVNTTQKITLHFQRLIVHLNVLSLPVIFHNSLLCSRVESFRSC